MNKFTACLNNNVRGKRERERAVSACGLKMEQKSYVERTEKIEKARYNTRANVGWWW